MAFAVATLDESVVPWSEAHVEALCNTPDSVIRENIRANARRQLPWLKMVEAHDGHAVICGGGPSLADTIGEIALRAERGQTIFALNGAADWLLYHGVAPHYQIIIDARPENVRFVERRNAMAYLIASQCAGELFDALRGEDVTLFHCAMDNLAELLQPTGRQEVMIGGEHTSGLMALGLVGTLGFRKLHLYGYDSSDRDDAAHAYAQEQTTAEQKRLRVKFNDRWYSTGFAMYKQAEEFPAYAQRLADAGCLITVHGDGLLPAMAREMTREDDCSVAIYDLSVAPASWDFAIWLIGAEMRRRAAGHGDHLTVSFQWGPDGGFRKDDPRLCVSAEYRQLMLDAVMRPLLGLVGAVETWNRAEGARYNYLSREIVDAAREGMAVPKFQAPLGDRMQVARWLSVHGITERPIVITLREATHWPSRNSNLEAWLAFAKNRKQPVVFVRDTEKADEPLPGYLTCPQAARDVRFRAALYEAALCNLSISNGPTGALCTFGDRPYLMFGQLTDQAIPYFPGTAEWWTTRCGVSVGNQYPWASPQQRLTWLPDTLENIEAEWASLKMEN